MNGSQLPLLQTAVPGPSVAAWMERLAAVECPAITARRSGRAAAGATDPILWAEARGANVLDTDGNRFVDLTAGFGVAAVGHAHPKVVETITAQAGRLIHGMGDLFPTREKILLAERLAARTPGRLQHSIFGCNGADAVEAAIKTAVIATGRHRVLGFHNSYHGLSHGALSVSGYRDGFRLPFAGRIGASDLRLPYASCRACPLGDTYPGCGQRCLTYLDHLLASATSGAGDIAAIIVEPMQVRGGFHLPPEGWLTELRRVTRARGILLIFDEVFTGFGRTGRWFAADHEGVEPDLLVVGKSLAGGLPLSACLGLPEVMEAWGATKGEAIHTSTFIGHPLACATALTTLDIIEEEGLVARSEALGAKLLSDLREAVGSHPAVADIRGRGLLVGVELQRDGKPWAGGGVAAMQAMLERGFLLCPAGAAAEVASFHPPLVVTEEQLEAAVAAFAGWLATVQA